MRVVGGKARGMTIAVPAVPDLRPTTDRVRGAIFSMLEARGMVDGALVLDLYAGSGALGIEALSRGARRAVLVERNARACATIRRNLAATRLTEQATVLLQTVSAALAALDGVYDLVLADPPYAEASELSWVVDELLRNNLVGPDSVLVVEQSARNRRDFSRQGVVRTEQEKTYGDTAVSIYTVEPAAAEGAL